MTLHIDDFPDGENISDYCLREYTVRMLIPKDGEPEAIAATSLHWFAFDYDRALDVHILSSGPSPEAQVCPAGHITVLGEDGDCDDCADDAVAYAEQQWDRQ